METESSSQLDSSGKEDIPVNDVYNSYATVPDIQLGNILAPDTYILHYIQRFQEKAFNPVSQFSSGPAGLPHLKEWLKYHQSLGKSANQIIQNLLDSRSSKTKQQPGLILYPMAPTNLTADELSIKLIVGIPGLIEKEERNIYSVEAQINGLRKINEPILSDYLKKRGQTPRILDNILETDELKTNPHLWLTKQDKTILPDWRKFLSVEYELINKANDILEKNDIDDYEFSLFRHDFLFVGTKVANTIKELSTVNAENKLIKHSIYLAKNSIGEFEHEEIRFLWVILSDLFETKLNNFIDSFSKLESKHTLSDLKQTLQNPDLLIPDGDNKYKVKRMLEMIAVSGDVLKKISNAKNEDVQRWTEYLIDVSETLKTLSVELAKKPQKEALKIIYQKVIDITQEIKTRSRGETSEKVGAHLTKLSLNAIFSEEIFEDPEVNDKNSKKVIEALKLDPCLAFCEYKNSIYFADVDYLFLIQTNLQNRYELERIKVSKKLKNKIPVEILEQKNVINQIIGSLPKTHPHIDDYQNLLRRKDTFSYNQANEKLMAAESVKKKRERVERQVAMLNEYAGIGSFAAIGVVLSIPIQIGLNIYGMYSFRSIGVNLLVLIGGLWLIKIFFGEKLKNKQEQAIIDEQLVLDNKIESKKESIREKAVKDFKNEISAIASEIIFPVKFHSIKERILTPNSMNFSIKMHLNQIKNKIPKLKNIEDEKAIATIKNSLAESVVTLSYKEPPKGKPGQYIFLRYDFKQRATRTLIGEYFREEKNNTPPSDNATHQYYNYFIDQIERHYHHYSK